MVDAGARARRAKLGLMGAFRLTGARGEAVTIASRRARGLLAYLAIAPAHTANRERLSGLLWSDRGEAQARASLRQCLLELRDIMAKAGLDVIDRGREEVTLRTDGLDCDLDELRQVMDSGGAAEFAAALASLGSSRLLEDLEIPGLYRDWLAQVRAQFDRALAQAVYLRIERMEVERDWRGVAMLAEAYLQRDPLDEAMVAAAMRSDIALGATGTAHRRFQSLQAALEKEFGVSPGSIARDALALATEPPAAEANAPPGVEDTGRGADVAAPPVPRVIVCGFDSADSPLLATHLRDEVLSGLSRFNDLEVVTDPRPLDLVLDAAAGQGAGAYVVYASVRASGSGARVTAQILVSGERRMVWSERYAPVAEPTLDGMDDVVTKIVGAVLPIILADIERHPPAPAVGSSAARAMLALGVDASPRTFAEAQAAVVTLEAMIRSDPTNAAPLNSLVYLYNTDFGQTRAGSSGPAERARALDLAKAAVAIDRLSAHARIALAWCYLRGRRWDLAKMHFDKALSLNPYHVRRMMEIGFGLIFLGEIEQSRSLLNRCLNLNPASHDDYFTDLGLLSMICGDHELAESYLEVGANPEVWCPIYMAINAQMAGRPSAPAVDRAVARLGQIWPEDRPLSQASMVAYIADHHPFRSAEVEQRFLAAASETFRHL